MLCRSNFHHFSLYSAEICLQFLILFYLFDAVILCVSANAHDCNVQENAPNPRIPQKIHRRIRSLIKCYPDGVLESKFKHQYKVNYKENLMSAMSLYGFKSMSSVALKLRMILRREVDSGGTARLYPATSTLPEHQRSDGRKHTTARFNEPSNPHTAPSFTPAMAALLQTLESQKRRDKQRERHDALLFAMDASRSVAAAGAAPSPSAPPASSSASADDDAWKTHGWADSSEPAPPMPHAAAASQSRDPPPATLGLRGGFESEEPAPSTAMHAVQP